ncbi:MAG: pantoate--beta-alanine ligase, partial [Fimbriimonadaceae bacterium]|nr:pantoate--beta-alanine ligase [Fimbriimonadaceae bacterium]
HRGLVSVRRGGSPRKLSGRGEQLSVIVARSRAELRSALGGRRSAFVPTMGALHEGHLALVRRAREIDSFTTLSIFVNPAQFGPKEDLSRYPRPIERDLDLAESEGVSVVYLPPAEEVYPEGFSTYVSPGSSAVEWEGSLRPGHFQGVCTVVLKLFNILNPHTAVFGWKDLQQCAVISQMCRDLDVDIRLDFLETVRESDGLARSSRNVYLSPDERIIAGRLNVLLRSAGDRIAAGERSAAVVADLLEAIRAAGGTPDYAALVDPVTMKSLDIPQKSSRIMMVVRVGSVRLLDNMPIAP